MYDSNIRQQYMATRTAPSNPQDYDIDSTNAKLQLGHLEAFVMTQVHPFICSHNGKLPMCWPAST